ncbi:succinate-semialdehyde dehydrogenase [NAD(P)+] [Roseibium sp. TrichSKD4]|uniref:NAD-dependent succinate-semialdehyde dehydrogenase n=1 Tax=Roseibium sp. TrichSKD4 TaxID=744980 RepID=UPI0001E57081|nr:NAD-dependent succinate-semialdehyde dehydrogenase [Roseibium sp. TrichSKD4]EFO31186.1 succinate-semialdehyde dehydrogenase [NAD(P)+] [Roseibium sp. TrichSKD4]
MLDLRSPELLRTKAYMNGSWVEVTNTFDVHNPATGQELASVADLTVDDVRIAICAAHRAQPMWAAKTGKERAALLRRWHDLMVAHADDLAQILTAEMGKPLAEAKGEVLYGASFIEWFAEEAKRIYGDVIPGHQPDKRIVVLKQPVGVVGSITPWNFPNAMIARKVAPALAVGCTFVARPSELTPLSALAMAELAHQAGIPAGVFNVVPSTAAAEVGEEFCSNEKIAKITFTGSTRVGKILMEQCASQVKKVSLELGGNAPFIVFDDADVDAAVEGALIAKFRNAGQTCVCANRIYAQAGIHDEFVRELSDRVREFTVGNGFQDVTSIGPLINKAAFRKVEAHISDAVAKGATVKVGGSPHALGGQFYEPTVVTGMTSDMLAASEETFGPVAPVFKFETEEQAAMQANDSEFGLAAYFYTQDLNRAWRMAEQLQTGMVGINTGLISTEVAPFGGIKQSGLGREGSKYGTDDYVELKYMCFGGIQ